MIGHTVYPNCSDSIFVSHDALCLTEYLLYKDIVRQHDIVAIALDYLQYYYWIICSGLLCIITGLLYLLRGRGFIPCYCLHSPPVSVQSAEHFCSTCTSKQHNLVFAKTFGVFSTNKCLMYLH